LSVESAPDGKKTFVAEPPSPLDDYEIVCPHCRKRFAGELIEGRAARYEGFKCPHCKLFVPLHRIEEQDATRP
jgi:hypothetical protein